MSLPAPPAMRSSPAPILISTRAISDLSSSRALVSRSIGPVRTFPQPVRTTIPAVNSVDFNIAAPVLPYVPFDGNVPGILSGGEIGRYNDCHGVEHDNRRVSRDHRPVRAGDRPRGTRPARDAYQDLLWLPDQFWRSTKHQCLPGLPGVTRRSPGPEPSCGGTRHRGLVGAQLPSESP